jgi:chromosome segregation ATPase
MPTPKPDPAATALSIEDLKQQYERLKTKQTQAETRRDSAKENLEALRAEARKNYGTDDVAELRKKLAEMTQENERKRAEYQAALAKIEADLQKVEADFAGVDNPANGKSGL